MDVHHYQLNKLLIVSNSASIYLTNKLTLPIPDSATTISHRVLLLKSPITTPFGPEPDVSEYDLPKIKDPFPYPIRIPTLSVPKLVTIISSLLS